jgi:hypothetical protein
MIPALPDQIKNSDLSTKLYRLHTFLAALRQLFLLTDKGKCLYSSRWEIGGKFTYSRLSYLLAMDN